MFQLTGGLGYFSGTVVMWYKGLDGTQCFNVNTCIFKSIQRATKIAFYQHYTHILLPHLGNKMRCSTVDQHFVTLSTHFGYR